MKCKHLCRLCRIKMGTEGDVVVAPTRGGSIRSQVSVAAAMAMIARAPKMTTIPIIVWGVEPWSAEIDP